ncbi:Glyoxylase, beta-lactamase superfamily II [Desulfacinum hydrothermale DSM 13146]|uniref:Glyoxylase, beta-lactamase superfamily II n=1 Tax=Desulfacinum hydrothermale DSM 13146 TaxID=1121390 RepID=A0A1W1XS27_9BACT|nr:N-acyl homoserine lactonase family protein [Desulfacinum hydrothermale]SMC26769.1 Glyoxylase, beta-lactamase superfamily II [Desulfacinum hydrothermale DSM 13146]
MREYTIRPLVVGANETDQGIMTYLKDYGKRIWIPIYVFVIQEGDETILVDTGLEEFMVPDHVGETYNLDILEFEDALASVGLRPEDVDVILHTHLHNDHCENDAKCPNATIVVQEEEYAFFRNPHPLDHRYYPDLLDGLKVETVRGDVAFRDGIDLIFTPGHTPGGQSVAVNTSAGRAIITGFCCNHKNFPATGPAITPGVHTDALAAYDSIQKIRQMADILIPLHDLRVGAMKSIPG